ncbi:MAG TPA: hypothetical protein VMW16_01775 [Sedimentisphaerales bacterium]|nr:hypothetical protein [Sedimentisphaerales bacterium]
MRNNANVVIAVILLLPFGAAGVCRKWKPARAACPSAITRAESR